MARKITMKGDQAQYVERRAPGTPGDDREIVMEGLHARYEESAGYVVNGEHQEVSTLTLMAAVRACGSFIWGNAAYAVPFCVIRDGFKGNGNASNYERQLADEGIVIPPGTINAAMSRNPWMKYHCDNWEQNGASERALKLRDFFKQMVSEAVAKDAENELTEEVHP